MIGSILSIAALTPLHIGIGRGTFEVDLPLARDEFSIPYIPGSSIKGALRARLRLRLDLVEKEEERNRLKILDKIFFGNPPEAAELAAGSVVITDAILVAIPVRTLYGIWAYVTSPFQLKRYLDYYMLATECHKGGGCCCKESSGESPREELKVYIEIIEEITKKIHEQGTSKAVVLKKKTLENLSPGGGEKIIINEEMFFEAFHDEETLKKAEELIKIIVKPLDPPCSEGTQVKDLLGQFSKLLKEKLIIVDDRIYKFVIERSIIRQTRVRLDSATKTVEEGPWTEENLPQFTLLASLIAFTRPRKRYIEGIESEGDVRKTFIREVINKSNPLVLGGHETIGRGLVVLGIC